MGETPTIEGLQAELAEREQEVARLRAELACWDAAERQRIEEQLRQSEAKTDDLIRYAPSGIYEVDLRTGRFRSVNDAMCKILGYTREELVGMSAFDLLDEAGKALFADRMRRTLAGEAVGPAVEYRVKPKDGRVIYTLLSTRILDQNGQPDRAFVIAHDVTERRRAAAEQGAILGAIADGLIVVDAQGHVVQLNAAAEEMLSYSGEQRSLSVQERLVSVLHPLKPDGSPCPPDEFPVIRALRGETVTNQEIILHVPARAGGPVRVAITSAPIRGPEGEVTGAVSTFTNVEAFHAVSEELRQANVLLQAQATELAQREAALRRAHDELEQRVAERTVELSQALEAVAQREAALAEANQSLQYQAMLLANINDAVVATDAGYLVTAFNHAAEELYGWRAAEVIGRPATEVFQLDLIGTTPQQAGADLITTGQWRGEVLLRRRDGSAIYCDSRAMVLKDDEGRITGYVGANRDMSERKQAEAQREAAVEALRASQEELRAYSRRLVEAIENERRNLARELHDQAGQSMSALKFSLARLRLEVDGQGQHSERFGEMEQLVESVMDDLHRLAVNLRPVSLDRYGLLPALQQYVEFYRRQSGLEVDLVAVGVEEQRLPAELETAVYRVIQEALTNVARHARATRVGVMLRRTSDNVVAIIEDNGQGFDPQEALRCNRLGLLGMRERAEMLGGKLTIESAPGKGTAVYVDLPLPVA